MAIGHDNLDYEIRLTLELAAELRLEGDPNALDEAIELEIACDYWNGVLPQAMGCLKRVERWFMALPLSAATLSHSIGRLVRQANTTASAHVVPLAQSGSSPMLSVVATRVASSAATAMLVVLPVAAVTQANAPAHAPILRAAVTPKVSSPKFIDSRVVSSSLALRNRHAFSGLSSAPRRPLFDPRFVAPVTPLSFGAASIADASSVSDASQTPSTSPNPTTDAPSATAPVILSAPPAAPALPPAAPVSGVSAAHQTSATSAGAISQAAPLSSTASTDGSSNFTDQLSVHASGTVSYSQLSGSPSLVVSATGAVTTASILRPGVYTATGTVTDLAGDSAPWSYSLAVNATASQVGATAQTVTTTASPTFAAQLAVKSNGAATFHQLAGSPSLTVTSSGAIATAGVLHAGTYTASGTDTDTYGDSGTWSYTLTVAPTTIVQSGQSSPSVATSGTPGFADQLATTGATGAVTYLQLTGSPSISVAPSGEISAKSVLHTGTYTASGTDTDAYGDSGTWNYTLAVTPTTIVQSGTGAKSIRTVNSASLADQLSSSGATGSVTYLQLTGSPSISVSASGAIATAAVLHAGTYTATGTDTDNYGDSGNWSYTLTVAPTTITQSSAALKTVPTTSSGRLTDQLATAGAAGTVTYLQHTGSPSVLVTSSGAISTTGVLHAGTYTASGTDADVYGDSGNWSYSLTVDATTITQSDQPTKTLPTTQSAALADQLATAGAAGTVTYLQHTGSPNLSVSPSGAISTAAMLHTGIYTASGTDTDAYGDSGTWSYALTVDPTTLTVALAGAATPDETATFTDQLSVSGANGPVQFTADQYNGTVGLMASPNGAISTTEALNPGAYLVAGTMTDAYGDSGTWSYTLHVAVKPAST